MTVKLAEILHPFVTPDIKVIISHNNKAIVQKNWRVVYSYCQLWWQSIFLKTAIINFCEFDCYQLATPGFIFDCLNSFTSIGCVPFFIVFFFIYWMTYAQGLFVKRKHQPKQRKKDKTSSPHNKLRCECNNLVTDVVTSVHITLLCPDF